MPHECPTCGRVFDSRRGLGVHHSHVHDERLPNRVCDDCGTEFYCDYRKKYCSEECRRRSVSFEGSANPNYSDATETTECEVCGAEFEFYPSEKEGRYCPDCVESEDWRDPPALEGADHPHWKGGPVELACEVCGGSVERYPSEITGAVTVCGDDCRAKWLSEAFAGSGHPNWKGGGNGAYGKGWNAVREKALQRDGYVCVVCGKTAEAIGRNPDVHHVHPVRAFVESETHEKTEAHRLDNVVSLCVGCHRKAEFGAIPKERLRELATADDEDGSG